VGYSRGGVYSRGRLFLVDTVRYLSTLVGDTKWFGTTNRPIDPLPTNRSQPKACLLSKNSKTYTVINVKLWTDGRRYGQERKTGSQAANCNPNTRWRNSCSQWKVSYLGEASRPKGGHAPTLQRNWNIGCCEHSLSNFLLWKVGRTSCQTLLYHVFNIS
jgi:hypothetical protein